MIQPFANAFMTPSVEIVNDKKTMTQEFRNFLQNLWGRTGGANGVPLQVAAALTAIGADRPTALQLGADINEFLTVPVGSGGALFGMQPGQLQIVFNGGANALNVYPSVGAAIDALAAGAPYVLAVGKTQIFTQYSLIQVRSLQLG